MNSHYIEEVGKKSLTTEELKWIDYIHKEMIPSMSLYTSSSVGNLKLFNHYLLHL